MGDNYRRSELSAEQLNVSKLYARLDGLREATDELLGEDRSQPSLDLVDWRAPAAEGT